MTDRWRLRELSWARGVGHLASCHGNMCPPVRSLPGSTPQSLTAPDRSPSVSRPQLRDGFVKPRVQASSCCCMVPVPVHL